MMTHCVSNLFSNNLGKRKICIIFATLWYYFITKNHFSIKKEMEEKYVNNDNE